MGEASGGFSWGDADDYNIHVKVTVNDVEINSDLKEVSLEPYMRLDFKDTLTSISPIEFDEWDKGENCFKNFGYSSKNYLTAVRNEENGNLEFECGMTHSTYKKTS